jgi:predicted nucleic acid-binding protein
MPPGQEDLVLQAEELLASYRSEAVKFLVPDLFWLELANALWKAARKGKIEPARAERALSLVRDLEIPTISSFGLIPQTLQLAVKYGRTVYDSVYVSLAVQAKAELITADERLANALAAHLPVKWLGAM